MTFDLLIAKTQGAAYDSLLATEDSLPRLIGAHVRVTEGPDDTDVVQDDVEGNLNRMYLKFFLSCALVLTDIQEGLTWKLVDMDQRSSGSQAIYLKRAMRSGMRSF